MCQLAEKENDKTEIAIGVDRRTREELVKWNQMTALRFQIGMCVWEKDVKTRV